MPGILDYRYMPMPVKFLIICTGYNCAPFVRKCYDSILKQEGDWEAVMISDGSNDATTDQLNSLPKDKRVVIENYTANMGAAFRRYNAIHNYADEETVILLLGMDDELLAGALTRITQEYDKGKWMTYGNWINQHGKMLPDGFLQFCETTHAERAYRQVKYRSTAPNTFKKFLFDNIPEEDFKIDGKWIDSTTESEVMFSCLEMCGKERIGVIEDAIYLYNESLPGGTLNRLGREYKYKLLEVIKSRPKKNLLVR